MAYDAQFVSTSLSFHSLYKSVPQGFRQSKGLSLFLVNSRINRNKHTRIFMEMQGNGSPTTSNQSTINIPHVLTVAGSDSGAGAGIQADLKACAARGVYCSTVITAVTAQNTVGVQGVNVVPEDFVAEQMKSVLSDMHVDVVKTGMLPSIGIVKILHQHLREYPVRALVVDPVMVSTSGDVLAGPSVLAGFREELLPMADIITPNLKEASALLDGVKIKTVSDMRSAAKLLHDKGARYHSPVNFSQFLDIF